MSLPFFYEPHYDADINFKLPSRLLPENTNKTSKSEDKFPYATFLLNKLPIYTEYAKVNDRLPDWMRARYLESAQARGLQCWATRTGIEVDGANHSKKRAKEIPV